MNTDGRPSDQGKELSIEHDEKKGVINVFYSGDDEPVLVQNVREDFRPYLHPITAPDGRGVLTEESPEHHPHQTGLYWGFTRLNGRDYFHNPGGEYWRRVSVSIVGSRADGHTSANHNHDDELESTSRDMNDDSSEVSWQTVYDLLDEEGHTVLTETQTWTMRESAGKFILDLEWKGKAKTDVTIGEYDYGGLFLRMPWREGISGEIVNAVRDRNQRAEGKRAMWLNVGMQVEGREDFAHIAIFDHSDNGGFPQPWRVDGEMGVGPVRARLGDWTIEEGETETIRHRLIIYTGEFSDVELTGAWEEYVEEENSTYSTASMWGIAQQEGRQAEFLTPDEAATNMTLIDGFKVTAWAGEPDITTPMAFAWDDRGRLWVAENNDYESRGDGFSAAGDSRILILEDADRDGYAENRKVFLEGIAFPSAIAVGFGGLFLGAPPNLLFVPDRDRDDIADMDDIEVLLTGWGIDDRHEIINSMHWGPDGWLYGLQGFATHSVVGKPKPGAERVYTHNDPFPESLDDLVDGEGTPINGGVWRYHPVKDRFEVVAHGLSNPWGIDHDAKGQLFVTACVIPHLWHIVPGGIYHRQGGSHFNPHIYQDIRTIADHRHRSAHGGASFYLSDAFPETHFGRVFMANIHEHAVLSDIVERKGSGFTARHGDDFMLANNAAWVGFSTEIGPDGGLYILDWHDKDICGTDVLNGDTGRIFKIMPDESQAEEWENRYADVSTLSDKQLVNLQARNSAWHARRARVNLQYRAYRGELEQGTHELLSEMFETQTNPDWRLRAMWALHVTGGFTESDLIDAMEDEDEYIRSWAIQMLTEDFNPTDQVIGKFRQMAGNDPSPVVRLYLASALQRLDYSKRWIIAENLMLHEEDEDDHNIPDMIWFGFEPLVAEYPEHALEIAGRSKISVIARFAARRAVEAEATETLVSIIGKEPLKQISLLEGLRDGLEGKSADLIAPSNWDDVYEQLQQSGDRTAEVALEVARLFGDTDASMQFLTLLRDRNAPVEQRREALRALASDQYPELPDILPDLLKETGLRTEAIRAIAGFDDENLGFLLLHQYSQFNRNEKIEAIRTLASRPVYGQILTRALRDGEISRRDIPIDVVRQLQRVAGNAFIEFWGPVAERTANDEQGVYEKYRDLLTGKALDEADVHRGRAIFQRTCGPCHTMYGEGGEIGPDLTGSNRTDLDYLLRNVINPSDDIQDEYKLVVVTTRDGRNYSGNVVGESERQITLRIVGRDNVVINKSDIQTREVTEVSMMPPYLFDTLTEQEVIDLVSYLHTTEQVDLPEN